MPGWGALPAGQPRPVPFNAVIAVSVFSADHRDPGAVRARTTSRSRSSRSPGSAQSASTSPTSSRCTCGCGRATRSRPGRGTSGSRYRLVNIAGDHLRDPGRVRPRPALHADRPAVERRLRRERRELHAARDPACRSSSASGTWSRRRTATRVRCGRSRRTRSRATRGDGHDARRAEEGGRGRHGRHRAADDRRHGGPAPGQAADRAATSSTRSPSTAPRAATTCSPSTST